MRWDGDHRIASVGRAGQVVTRAAAQVNGAAFPIGVGNRLVPEIVRRVECRETKRIRSSSILFVVTVIHPSLQARGQDDRGVGLQGRVSKRP
jgi:hypothetical protein